MMSSLIDIVQQAGDKVMAIYRSGDFKTQVKKDQSPVTTADTLSHQILTDSLTKEFNLPVLSEEAEPPPMNERRHWLEYFLIDPLDGTKDFMAKNDEFTINLALIKNRKPEIGLVMAPALGELFVAERGQGARLLKGNQTIELPRGNIQELIYARSWQHDNSHTDRLAQANAMHQGPDMSSALRLPRLAEGVISFCLCSNRGFEWDVAPGHLLVTETGGTLVDLSTGQEPVYNKPNLFNNFLIGYSGHLDWKKLKNLPENP